MRDIKRAFGSPDAAFHDRVRQTLFQIEDKEEAPVKKKLTFSMAMAVFACLTVFLVSALAASNLILAPNPDATQTPLSEGSGTDYLVWMDADGRQFHSDAACINAGSNLMRMHLSAALSAGGLPCADCEITCCINDNETMYYHTPGDCEKVTSPNIIPLADALKYGFAPCPDCLPGYVPAGPTPTPMATYQPALPTPIPISTMMSMAESTEIPQPTVVFDLAQPTPMPVSGVMVYSAKEDERYHTTQDCSAIGPDPYETDEEFAISVLGKTACTRCLLCWFNPERPIYYHATENCYQFHAPDDGTPYFLYEMDSTLNAEPCPKCVSWITNDDPFVHSVPYCGDMTAAYPVRMFYALNIDKTVCSDCIRFRVTPSSSVYAFSYGDRYHDSSTCRTLAAEKELALNELVATSGSAADLEYLPQYISEEAAIASGKIACIDCLPCFAAGTGSRLYHMDRRCAFLEAALGGTVCTEALYADTETAGMTPCPDCVYWTNADDNLYHSGTVCLTGWNARYIPGTLNNALLKGCVPCPDCITADQSSEQTEVCTIESDVFFHISADCPSVAGKAVLNYERTWRLIEQGDLLPCPVCCGETDSAASSVDLMLSWPVENPSETPKALVFIVNGFDQGDWGAGSDDMAVSVHGTDALNIHSMIYLQSRSCLFIEAELTLNDDSIAPETLFIAPWSEEQGYLYPRSAAIQQVTYENGETGYLLTETLPLLADDSSFETMRIYLVTRSGEHEYLGDLT